MVDACWACHCCCASFSLSGWRFSQVCKASCPYCVGQIPALCLSESCRCVQGRYLWWASCNQVLCGRWGGG